MLLGRNYGGNWTCYNEGLKTRLWLWNFVPIGKLKILELKEEKIKSPSARHIVVIKTRISYINVCEVDKGTHDEHNRPIKS